MAKVRAQMMRLKNILGIDDIEISPGDVTIIEGKNAAGKTSCLDGLKAVFTGGKDATLKRNGAESGESVLLLSDGMRAVRTVNDTKTGGDFKLIHPDFGPLRSGRTLFDKMIDVVSLDPARFMVTTDEERLVILTEAADIQLSEERIALDCNLDIDTVKGITSSVAGLSALELIAHVRKSISAIRLDRKKVAAEKRASIAQLAPSLSGVNMTVDWAGEERAAKKKLADHREDLAGKLRAIKSNFERIERNHGAAYLEARVEKRAEADRAIAAARAEADRLIAVAEAKFQLDAAEAMTTRDSKVDEARVYSAGIEAKDRATIQPLIDAELVAATQAEANSIQMRTEANTTALMSQFEADAVAAEEYIVELTAAIDGCDDLKRNLLKEVPIEGLDVVDGVIYMAGVPFKRLNRQKQIGICIEVAKLRAKGSGLGLVIIDNLECLDSEHLQEFVDQALQTELQWIIGRVTDQPGVNIRIINADDRRAA